MIKVEYRERSRRATTEYVEFERDKAIADGLNEAAEVYDSCLEHFLTLSKEERREGITYTTHKYSFAFKEEE